MFQPDLFASRIAASQSDAEPRPLDLPAILKRLTDVCERPRYSFIVLNLIAQVCNSAGAAGPYVRAGDALIPIREWLCDALMPVAQHASRRCVVAERVRKDLILQGTMPKNSEEAELLIAKHVERRLRHSGLTNVSRAVSELVRAGFVQRHYQGYRVDHHNRGAQRQAVYTVDADVLKVI